MRSGSPPKVSIGLPVYNGARYLQTCLDSILEQDFDDLELVVSDNASTDETVEICQRYASRDGRIRVFRQDTNIGAAANFAFVLREARGTSFMWIACDDYYESPALVSALYDRSRRGVALAVPDVKHRDLTKVPPVLYDHPEARRSLARSKTRFDFLAAFVTSPLFPISIYGMFNRQALRELGVDLRMDPSLAVGGDCDLLHRLIAANGSIEFVHDVCLVYSRRADSASASSKRLKQLRDFVEYNRRLPRIYAGSTLGRWERIGLLGRLIPSHTRYLGVLVASCVKHWAMEEWRARGNASRNGGSTGGAPRSDSR